MVPWKIMNEGIYIESYKFWDVVSLWGRETLEHDVLVARKLANGVIKQGLRMQSKNPEWMDSKDELLSYPYIGYTVIESEGPIILKAVALAHLINITEEKEEPSKIILNDEAVLKSDFKKWLVRTGQSFPEFWYGKSGI
jgi:hypothetical protein